MSAAAILGSWDTKRTEMRYLRDRLEAAGIDALYVDVSTLPTDDLDEGSGYSSQEVRADLEDEWEQLAADGRGAKIDFMAEAVKRFVVRLAATGDIDGVLSVGGLQNTTLATSAMKALPVGFPKVMATTVASGLKPFRSVVGERDIVVIPALADLTGINFATRSTLDTACDCLIGLISGHSRMERPARSVVGLTLMGVTNSSAVGAVRELEVRGFEAVGFHATGTGGGVMEEFVGTGFVDGVLDLNLHEIVNEYFGGGYSYGALDRLQAEIKQGVPLVVAPGGLDFVDYFVADFAPGLQGRKYVLHNGSLAHIKLTVQEAIGVGTLVGSRLSASVRPIPFLVPSRGLRDDTAVGEPLHDPEVDAALIDAIVASADGKAALELVDMSLNSEEFGAFAARRYAETFAEIGAGREAEVCRDE